ncbi:electron transfer flavoprotein subunit alpha [Marinomonas transparens]|uniref:Electron transfer flavoprotein subunit alpha/FixB family protein n=1 Tax=Marinomonas transparens TaxID=2795388 RepID=A0A934JSE1_9GAMM|nr:electron transfer flavoprotein subunit alpha/FixB family protein [Marinomonas transparens]MBJ7537482.1 electron transfer flavoprotein subunit alpha/FixB family protein [Marinomonas transparens]
MSDFSSDNIIRRDPRAEWIARNRLHPLHDSVVSAGRGEVRGPSGLLRKNPHLVGFIGPNGIKRIDRANTNSSAIGGKKWSAPQDVVLPLHQVVNPEGYIVVVPDMVGGRLTAHDKDILGLAHKLAGEHANFAVVAVCFGESKETQFDLAGVDRLIHLFGSEFDGFAPEARLSALMQIDAQYQPQHWLFPDSINGGADLASRLAARLGERPATQAWQVSASKTVCRGASASTDITRETPKILMLLEECGDAIDETRHEALPLDLDGYGLDYWERAESRLVDKGLIAVDPNAIPLAEAEFILSAGNGIHNWDQFHECARALGATEGASRVAVDDGFMPRARQVGASGTWVTARLYLAVGISGAIQHMQGIGQCDKVIAINTDAACDMVKRADLAVVADSEEVLSELIKLAQQYPLSIDNVSNVNEENSDAA